MRQAEFWRKSQHKASMTTAHQHLPFCLDPEPCSWFDDAFCHRQLTATPVAYLNALQHDLQRIANGELAIALPPKQLFADSKDECDAASPGKGDFRVMPCVVRGSDRITKTVKIVGSNFSRKVVRNRMTVGRALYLDPQENFCPQRVCRFRFVVCANRGMCGNRSSSVKRRPQRDTFWRWCRGLVRCLLLAQRFAD